MTTYNGKSTHQRDVLNETVCDISEYYESNPDTFFNNMPNKPTTKALKEKQHYLIRGMAKERLKSAPRPLYRQIEKDEENRIILNETMDDSGNIRTQEQRIEIAYNNSNYEPDRSDWTELDEHIVSANLDQATITDESKDIISQYFIQNPKQIQAIIPYFQNKVLVGLSPNSLWKVKVFKWKASDVYELLEDIDTGEPILPMDKGYLYMFYLMICIAALEQKWSTSVKAVNSSSMVIGRQHIPTLTTLVIKTFLHFTNNLNKKVFSHFKLPPPIRPAEVTAFSNLIKDKPRNLLKSMNVPLTSVPKPPKKPKTTKMMMANTDDSLPETFNLEEVFESYEVFAALTNNISESFLEGKIKDEPVHEPIILVRLKSISDGSTEAEILEAVRGPWAVSIEKLEKVEYIIPLVSGVALDVCKLDDIKQGQEPGRWECTCSMADDTIRAKYKGSDFSDQFPKGSANPVKYLNV